MTPFQEHCKKWAPGCGSGLCDKANRAYGRGKIPCDVLFIGEAPGESENVLRMPFVGPAGKLLDRIINRAMGHIDEGGFEAWTYCLTNLVLCVPRDETAAKSGEPLPEEVRACAPRLREMVDLCQPKLIVCVGNLARDYLDTKTHGNVWQAHGGRQKGLLASSNHPGALIPRIHITHPAHILRANIAQQSLAVQQCIVKIVAAIEEYL